VSKKRQSIQPTYDSRETGDRYHVTSRIGDRTITFQEPISDPFVRTTVTVGWPDILRGLLRRRLTVTVLVGGDPQIIDDVLELDANTLVSGSTRRDEFNQGIHAALGSLGAFDDLPTTGGQR
jgi:hypothetical protein